MTPDPRPPSKPDLAKAVDEIVRDARVAMVNPILVSVSERGHIRRNSPCPCGSGQKYKKCCYRDVDAGKLPMLRADGYAPDPPPTAYGPTRRVRRKLVAEYKEAQRKAAALKELDELTTENPEADNGTD